MAPSAPPAPDGSRWNRDGVSKVIDATIAAAKADGRLEKWVADYTAEADSLKETSDAGEAAAASGATSTYTAFHPCTKERLWVV